MSHSPCLWLHEVTRVDVPIAGGKGANLGDMVQAGLPVPPGFVITSDTFRGIIERSGLEERIEEMLSNLDRSDCDQLHAVEGQIRQLFREELVPAEVFRAIAEAYRSLGDRVPVAVRSSATAEDLAGASFAGQQETILNVVGEEALIKALVQCFSSLYTSQAMFYRSRQGFEDSDVSMAVVVQRMVDSQKSGVTFTVDPVLYNRYNMIIEGVWGLGEGIVSGRITPDHYKIDRETYELVEHSVAEKQIMICRQGCGGIETRAVPPDQVTAPVLTDQELHTLVDLGNRIEKHFGCPQDIEWGIEGGQIYILQSRAITSL